MNNSILRTSVQVSFPRDDYFSLLIFMKNVTDTYLIELIMYASPTLFLYANKGISRQYNKEKRTKCARMFISAHTFPFQLVPVQCIDQLYRLTCRNVIRMIKTSFVISALRAGENSRKLIPGNIFTRPKIYQ